MRPRAEFKKSTSLSISACAPAGEPHVLIDTRENDEWAAGHAAGAVHLGKGIIERDIEAQVPRKDAKLVLYCGGGYRSALAADALRQMGYTNAISLDGGWRAYQASGLPLEKVDPSCQQLEADQHGRRQVEHGAQGAEFEKLHHACEAGVHEFKSQHQRQAEAGANQPERHHAVDGFA